MMIGTMLTGCGGGNKKDSGSSKKETYRDQQSDFLQVGAESDWRVANTKYYEICINSKERILNYHLQMLSRNRKIRQKRSENFITQGVDVIAIAPVTETGWETVFKRSKES